MLSAVFAECRVYNSVMLSVDMLNVDASLVSFILPQTCFIKLYGIQFELLIIQHQQYFYSKVYLWFRQGPPVGTFVEIIKCIFSESQRALLIHALNNFTRVQYQPKSTSQLFLNEQLNKNLVKPLFNEAPSLTRCQHPSQV